MRVAPAPLMMPASCVQASTSSMMQLTYGCTVGYACEGCARVANDAGQLCAGAHVVHDATDIWVYGRIRRCRVAPAPLMMPASCVQAPTLSMIAERENDPVVV